MGLTNVSAAELLDCGSSFTGLGPPLGFTIPSMGSSLTQNIVVIHVDALEAALANLNLPDIGSSPLSKTRREVFLLRVKYLDSTLNYTYAIAQPRKATHGFFSSLQFQVHHGTCGRDERARLLKLRERIFQVATSLIVPDPHGAAPK
jgi:hypothetical protein